MKFLLFSFYLFSIHIILGQSNYVPGFIVDNNNDTLTGYINYKDWITGPFKIEYKKDLNAVETSYLPNQIKFFSVNDKEEYLSAYVWMDKSPEDVNEVFRTTERIIIKDFFFLKTILRSASGISLY